MADVLFMVLAPVKLNLGIQAVSQDCDPMKIANTASFVSFFCHNATHQCHNDYMDAINQKLLALLRTDARTNVATLAQKLGVSRGTVTNRITKLEDAGIIVGYTVRLRPDAQPDEIKAWMSIAVEGNEARTVIASLLGEPGVATLHDTNGRWDLLAELRAQNLSELSKVLERIRLIRGISNTESSIHLETYRLS
jgi:DNA-binding Lrp family transcriptional regulator